MGLAIVVVALGVGLLAAGIIDPSPFLPDASSNPTASVGAGATPSRRPSPEPSPSAKPPAGDVATLVGAGDIADCDRSEDELTANLVETIPGTVFTLGDNANPDGSRRAFEDCYTPTWGRESILERTRPAAGDADYDTPDAAPYFDYFGEAAGEPGAGYYAYDAATWRVYVLNSNCASIGGCGEGSAQEAWLLQDLEAEPRDCVLAMWHHAYFTSGPSGGGSSSRRNLWRVLQEAGAELALSGHDHHYERFAPLHGDGTLDPSGMVQFVVGTGGSRPDDLRVTAPHSEVRQTDVAGVLHLSLRPGGYEFEFISVAGTDFTDRGSGSCH